MRSWRKNTRVSSGLSGTAPEVSARDHEGPAGPQGRHRVPPGGRADRLHHRVDPLREPGAGLHRVVRAQVERPRPLGLVAAGREDPQSRGTRERDQRRRHATAGPLHEHAVAGPEPALGEEHPVRRQPGGRQAGGLLEGQRGGLRYDVAARHRHPLAPGCPGTAPRGATASGPASRRRARTGSLMTAWTITSLPSSSSPAASHPRIIGSRSAGSPTPCSEKTSWWLSDAASTRHDRPAVRHLRARGVRRRPVRPAGRRR